MKDAFSTYHPLVNFIYFAVVILFSMFLMHPVFLCISFASAFLYSLRLNGKRALKFNLLFLVPFLLVMALLNPLFNHQGVTILFYASSGNPITLEAVLYGFAAALMFVSVICWFSCYNAVMTSDKFLYLFGRVIPALSLVFSMVLRFVPRFKAQICVITRAQACMGRDLHSGNLWQRMKNGVQILSIMVTWALEHSIETATSMKSRGYGLPGRTVFSIFYPEKRDRIFLLLFFALSVFILAGFACGIVFVRYYPALGFTGFAPVPVIFYIGYLALCLLPLIIDLVEEHQWKRFVSIT